MYHRVLSAIDGSLNAFAAGRYAVAVAQACGATLYVAGVITRKMTGREEGALAESAARLVAEGEKRGVRSHILIERGEAARTLHVLAKENKADVVLAASRHEDAEHRYFVRTVPQRLTGLLPMSLIVVRVANLGVLAHPREILVPVTRNLPDGSAERAYLVSRLAKHYGARLVVLHALEGSRQEGRAALHEAGARRVQAFVERLDRESAQPQLRIVADPLVGRAIMREAARHRHDLIIMGASRRTLFARWRRGNPVEEVMRQAPCDLFVCRLRGA